MAASGGKNMRSHGGGNKDTPDICRRRVTIKGVTDDISDDMIMQHVRTFGSVEGRISRRQTINPGEPTTVFITFESINSANRFMDHQEHRINGLPYQVMRGNMKDAKGSGEQISRLSVSYCNSKDRKLTDEQKNKYFSRFGPIHCITYQNEKEDFFVDYDYFDSADKAVLSQQTSIHIIDNTAKVTVEKDAAPYWIRGTGLPNEFTYADLLELLNVKEAIIRVVDVLSDPSEGCCWIQANKGRVLPEPLAHIQANNWTVKAIQKNSPVVFKPVRPIIFRSQLCGYYRSDGCTAQPCRYEHIPCALYNICSDDKCWFGHSRQRGLHPRKYEEETTTLFCTKIIGLPDDTDHYKLSTALGNHLKNNRLRLLPRTDSHGVIAYVHWHPASSLKDIRKSLDKWHGSRYDLKYPIQCQLEIDHSNPLEEEPTILENDEDDTYKLETYRDEVDVLSNRHSEDTELDANGCPSDWNQKYHWTGEDLSGKHKGQAVVFGAVRRKDRHECVVKVYTNTIYELYRFRARREIIALQRLSGVPGVAQLLDTNVKLEEDDENAVLWAILDRVQGVTLREKIQDRVGLLKSMEITQKLHTIVSAFHALEIVHRDIKPANIMIGNDNELTVIDFGMAFIRTYERFEQPVDDQTTFVEQDLANQFFQPPQLEKQLSPENEENENYMLEVRRSPTIDASAICAILFWLITGRKPVKVLWKDTVVHKVKDHNDLIENAIREATDDKKLRKLLRTQLTMLFDGGFGNFDEQWTDKLLKTHLQSLVDLLNQDEEDTSEEEKETATGDKNGPVARELVHSGRANSVISYASSRSSCRNQAATSLTSSTRPKDTDMQTSTAAVPKNSVVTMMNNETGSPASVQEDDDSFKVVRRRK